MPKPVPRELVSALTRSGITALALGHTPQGNAPTAVQCGGLLVVAASSASSASNVEGVSTSSSLALASALASLPVGLLHATTTGLPQPPPRATTAAAWWGHACGGL